jgi:hypothetical protein
MPRAIPQQLYVAPIEFECEFLVQRLRHFGQARIIKYTPLEVPKQKPQLCAKLLLLGI